MKLTALTRVRRGKPVRLLIEAPGVTGSIHLWPINQTKKVATVATLGELKGGEVVHVEILKT